MPLIKFVSASNGSREVSTEAGKSLMQVAMENGINEIVAECGGSCSCATCHVYIDEAWFDKTGKPDDIEKSLLDCVLEPSDTSRLSCQVNITEEVDGLVVRLPESQY